MTTLNEKQAGHKSGLYQRRTLQNERNYFQQSVSESYVCDLSFPDGDTTEINKKKSNISLIRNTIIQICTSLTEKMKTLHRWRTQILMTGIIVMGIYMLLFRGHGSSYDPSEIEIDERDIEQEIENAKTVGVLTFKPPKEDQYAWAKPEAKSKQGKSVLGKSDDLDRTMKYHRIWGYADKVTNVHELFSDTPDVDTVLSSLATAKIVHVDVLDPEEYESGTSEKWVVTLEGGQKAMMKLSWTGEKKGGMKNKAHCNFGFEMPWAEIAAFHLHRILSFRNTPYATGRKVDLRREILPVASPAVSKQITIKSDSETCVTGKCFHCDEPITMCPPGGIVEASLVYWVPRRLRAYTFPPEYMPFSTPNIHEWEKYGFNNKTFCEKVRKKEPYNNDRYYHDLFDFAVIDTMMYHYDSKHYIIQENTNAHGLTVRLDHGRAFCAYDQDLEHVFLAPLTQCCILRRETYWTLKSFREGHLSDRLRNELARDPIAPILDEAWYPTLERRLKKIVQMADKCAAALGGLQHMLVG